MNVVESIDKKVFSIVYFNKNKGVCFLRLKLPFLIEKSTNSYDI